MSIAENIAWVRERIAAAARRVGRADNITLVGVSKTFPVECIREAYAGGAPRCLREPGTGGFAGKVDALRDFAQT